MLTSAEAETLTMGLHDSSFLIADSRVSFLILSVFRLSDKVEEEECFLLSDLNLPHQRGKRMGPTVGLVAGLAVLKGGTTLGGVATGIVSVKDVRYLLIRRR